MLPDADQSIQPLFIVLLFLLFFFFIPAARISSGRDSRDVPRESPGPRSHRNPYCTFIFGVFLGRGRGEINVAFVNKHRRLPRTEQSASRWNSYARGINKQVINK